MSTPASLRIIRDEHAALAAMLQSLLWLIRRGPEASDRQRFFDTVRAMLFYIDEFPERLHHPKESDLLFPCVAKRDAELLPVIARLEQDHMRGEQQVRELQHLLLAWEWLGEERREAFVQACERYLNFYLEHMRLEEQQILPAAQRLLTPEDWQALDEAFAANRDPLTGHAPAPAYERLFQRILEVAPAPIGLGA
ncbi:MULTISPECIES: hemerythrin domain-containing protein [Tepidimonas]|uniref:Hemerythrin HHE cation binding domain protein n=2 Tax=Tepidimonas TaxID=114248 RepID=A0A4R3LF31_9BURK|nr:MULTISPECIES: hemerythrin domain-containing protein [Tepidimonas]TCS96066.1 hemerythrin-like domain-containing protein [Tepidimonas ignava]TSE21086.1 Hemerythrin HHE cation binding domain protein [Tepidimonas ignava]TSE21753.1 Hemerythrin HHE cation binding domain protein [Tepidimonas aquatica]